MTDNRYHPGRQFRHQSRLGMRGGRFHSGIDWSAPLGTPVRADADGKAIFSGKNASFGYTVIIQHRDAAGNPTFRTGFTHLQPEDLPEVDQDVYRGDIIGRVGNTGSVSDLRPKRGVLHYIVFDRSAPPPNRETMTMGFNLSDPKLSGYLQDPAVGFDYGPSGVYNDENGSPEIIYRPDRFYRQSVFIPLYGSNFITPAHNAATLANLTPWFKQEPSESVPPTPRESDLAP